MKCPNISILVVIRGHNPNSENEKETKKKRKKERGLGLELSKTIGPANGAKFRPNFE